MEPHTIHPQLLADCHPLGELVASDLLLHRNASLHWFVVVPRTTVPDLLDLPALERAQVISDCGAVSSFLKGTLGYGKVNFAGLGNVVPQMHLHVIGRRPEDACWPSPVWGNLPEGPTWSIDAIETLRVGLTEKAGLRLR
ncbi:MAG: HIT family protein [Myxococcota bacterium]